jgi:hypothetical protein
MAAGEVLARCAPARSLSLLLLKTTLPRRRMRVPEHPHPGTL